jgi:hypothetical protein
MCLRRAVPKIPPKSSVPPTLPFYKIRPLLTHPESTLLQVLIPLHFNSPRINTYKKPGGGAPLFTPKFCNSLLLQCSSFRAHQRGSCLFLCSLFTRHSPLLLASLCNNIIPWDLRFLCFHTLTHSFVTSKTPSPLFSIVSALFAKNTPGAGRSSSALLHYSLPTIHSSRPSPRTSTLPPRIYGIIPPHRGNARNPIRKQGGFSD